MQNITKQCNTHVVKVYVTGPYEKVLDICSEYCLEGFCVSLKKVEYVYKMGIEQGVEITIVNYPRFPDTKESLECIGMELGIKVTVGCHQGSFTMVCPEQTYFWSRRDGDLNGEK